MKSEILQPIVALAAWTMVMWLWMYATRIPAMGKVKELDTTNMVGGTGAKLDGADLTGANLARADLQGASFRGVLGLDRTFGLSAARNRPAMLP